MDSDLRSLVLNAASLGPSSTGDVAAFNGRRLVQHDRLDGIGATGALPAKCRDMIRDLGWKNGPDLIIAVLGPGSFTGLRASLSLANGLAFGFGARLRGVTTGACFRTRLGWENTICVTQARRDRVFVEWPDGSFWAGSPAECPVPEEAILVGPGSSAVSPPGTDHPQVIWTGGPDIAWVLEAGLLSDDRSVLSPLYIDAPEAKLPARGLRPAPF